MTGKELARRLEGSGITVLIAHPGLAVTDHFGKSDSENKLSSKLIETNANSPIGQSAENGAIPLEFCCTAEQLEGTSICNFGVLSLLLMLCIVLQPILHGLVVKCCNIVLQLSKGSSLKVLHYGTDGRG